MEDKDILSSSLSYFFKYFVFPLGILLLLLVIWITIREGSYLMSFLLGVGLFVNLLFWVFMPTRHIRQVSLDHVNERFVISNFSDSEELIPFSDLVKFRGRYPGMIRLEFTHGRKIYFFLPQMIDMIPQSFIRQQLNDILSHNLRR